MQHGALPERPAASASTGAGRLADPDTNHAGAGVAFAMHARPLPLRTDSRGRLRRLQTPNDLHYGVTKECRSGVRRTVENRLMAGYR